MQNTWFKNLDTDKIKTFLKKYFQEKNKDILISFDFKNNNLGQKFIEVQILDDSSDYFETYAYLGEYFILSPDNNLDYINDITILESIENFQDLYRKWINFLYQNNKNTKINNKTYKEFLTEKLSKNLLSFYENEMAFVINNYLKNENGFTENATITTLKAFKQEYEKELKNLPNIVNSLTKDDEYIK